MPEGPHFLLGDDHHINRRNFAALFELIERGRVPWSVHRAHGSLKQCLGAYQDREELAPYRRRLEQLPPDELFQLEHPYRGTPMRLFPLYRAETLAFALAQRARWHETPPARADRAIFDALLAWDRDLLLGNAAAAQFWIDEFARLYAQRGLPFSHVFVFGGSMIFTRVLMQLCKLSEAKCIVLESAFTGHQFLAEERYTPLAAGPDIRHPAVRASLRAKLARADGRELRPHSVMAAAENKNVRQPEQPVQLEFREHERPALLIVGQVVNDFSLIEQRGCPLSSLAFYREFIGSCLQHTEYNLIFKAHPWEQRKQHVQRAFTRDQIALLRESLPAAQQARLIVLDSANLISLGHRVDRVALLNSQAGLELAYHCGLRPSTFGEPYYAGAGFTDDYADIDAFLDDVRARGPRARLTLDDFEHLLGFLHYFLGLHCVTNGARGAAQLAEKLGLSFPLADRRAPPRARRLAAKTRKLLRDPQRFLSDSAFLRRLFEPR